MITVVMTAYNEAATLTRVLDAIPGEVLGLPIEVVVVDDGSSDATAAIARESGCSVVGLSANRGKGAALRRGLAQIDVGRLDALVLMDADGQHAPGEIERVVSPILDGSADLVIGSRYLENSERGATPWNRYAVRCVTVGVIRSILGWAPTDPYCGFRALSPRAVACVELRGDRYESELETIFSAARHHLEITEVPVSKIYGPATSKMGGRWGAVGGRVDVVTRYAFTIARETILLRRASGSSTTTEVNS
jgi:glycosyltransferase involved in cell wall biosynthesis